jgi:hypothetical protein
VYLNGLKFKGLSVEPYPGNIVLLSSVIEFCSQEPKRISVLGKLNYYSDGLGAGVSFLAGVRDFSIHNVETNSGAHPAFCPMGKAARA